MIELPLYDNQTAMAAATGIPIDVIRHAQRNGCAFQHHGRCDLKEFLKWFFNQGSESEGSTDWGKREKRAKALLKEVELEREKDKVIEFALVDNFLRKLVQQIFFGELNRLEQEFPPGLKGKREVEIAKEVTAQIEKVKKNLKSELLAWEKSKGKE
jgi:hypothetical protein